jgi:putative ubiquitin-RnfH superfamily antitoxin RatB of RatAB toxin-antitoxin module
MASWEDDIIISPVGGAPVSVLQGGNPPWLNDRVDQKGNPLRLPEEESTIKDWMIKNAATPGGIGGSLVGALAGSPFGPGGTIAGTVIGGALGSGAGSVASDVMQDKDINEAKALYEVGLSLAIDLGTFGLGKYIARPLWEAAKRGLAKGVPPEQVVKDLADGAMEAKGRMTPEVAQSQEILMKDGLTLTPFQTGIASAWEISKELLGGTGLLSKNIFDARAKKVTALVQDRLETITAGSQGVSNDVIGEGIFNTIHAGRSALSDSYGDELTRIGLLLKGKKFDLDVLRNAVEKHAKHPDNVDALKVSTLDDSAQGIIKDLLNKMGDHNIAPASYLLDFEKRLNEQINLATKSVLKDPAKQSVVRDLTGLKKSLQKTITNKLQEFGGDAGKEYRKLQEFNAFHMGELLPTVNQNLIMAAKGTGLYTTIGKTFGSVGKVSQVEKLMGSIDEAYRLIPKEQLKNLAFKNASEAKDAIRQSYVTELFPDLATSNFSLDAYRKIARQLKSPTEAKRIKAILGPKYEGFRRTVNLMEHASANPTTGIATLFLRGKEYFAATSLAIAPFTGIMDITTAGLSAIGIFGLPAAMAKAATNPKYINRMIKADQLGSQGAKSRRKALMVLSGVANDILDELYAENMGSDNFIQQLKKYKVLDID